MTIGERIKNYRKENGLTLRAFAEKCGMSHSYIAMLENGKNSKTGEPMLPNVSTVEILARALNVSPGWLVGWSDKKEREDPI